MSSKEIGPHGKQMFKHILSFINYRMEKKVIDLKEI